MPDARQASTRVAMPRGGSIGMAGQKRSLGHGGASGSSKAPRRFPPADGQPGFAGSLPPMFGEGAPEFAPAIGGFAPGAEQPRYRSAAPPQEDDAALIYESEAPITAKPGSAHGNGGRPLSMAVPLHAAPVRRTKNRNMRERVGAASVRRAFATPTRPVPVHTALCCEATEGRAHP